MMMTTTKKVSTLKLRLLASGCALLLCFGAVAQPVGLPDDALEPRDDGEVLQPQDEAVEPAITAYRVGKVITMNDADAVINNAVVLVADGKILKVGRASEIEIPARATIIDMPDCWLAPGLVEGHNHINADSGDLHDYVYLTNPGLRTLDSVDTENESIERARAGGVTSALLISGSGTNMSGLGTMVKMSGGSTDDSVFKFPASIKIAQAGNPERYWYGVGRSMMNYNTRHTLMQALEYHQRWEAYEGGQSSEQPAFDPTYDDFRGLFRGEFVASVHTQQYQVVMTTLDMLASGKNGFKLRTVLDHSTFDGFKTAPLVREMSDNVVTINGPRQFWFDRSQRRVYGNAARWWQGNVGLLGVNTDSPVVPQEELSYQAAMGCWYGWSPYQALKGVTRAPAEALMVDDRVGSIQPGKDADFGIWSGDPIDPRSTCWITVVNGKIVHDSRTGIRRF
ncbi:MAG: amidohydrolase family protein [Phycisphaerales bacterium]